MDIDITEEILKHNNMNCKKSVAENEEIDALASKLEQEYDSLSFSSSDQSSDQDDISIQKQVANIEVLIAQTDLEDAHTRLDQAKKVLQIQQIQLKESESSLHEKDDMISRLKLERDLAEAEKRMIKHQLSIIVDVKGKVNTSLDAAQFYPIDRADSAILNAQDMEAELFNDVCVQEKLHRSIIKQLDKRFLNNTYDLGMAKRLLQRPRSKLSLLSKPNCFYRLVPARKFDSSHDTTTPSKFMACRLFFTRRNKSKNNYKSYQAIQNCHQEESISLEDINNNNNNRDGINLMEEIHNFDTMHREKMRRIQRFVKAQSNQINLLQHEVDKLIEMNIVCDDSTFTSTDEEDSTMSSECLFSICSGSQE